jgi:radical SAM protein with 4Fe4S-binding SPASM domain
MITHKQKFFLFKQSENFCSVPWNHFKVSMDGAVYTCNPGSDVIGDLKTQSIEEIISNPRVQECKQNLFGDKEDKNCVDCKKLEIHDATQDYLFLKNLYNPMFVSADVDYSDSTAFTLSGIDLHWGSTCNLKCITCWDKQSSAIAQEVGSPILNTPTEVADKLIDFIVARQTTLKEIYLSGGEPTLIKHNLRLLTRLRKDLNFVIRVNTNMTFDQDNLIIQELKKFPNVLFTISADATLGRFEYIRRGADWNVFIRNLKDLQQYKNFSWRVNSVFFVASALGLADTQEFFMENYGITDFTINQVGMGHKSIRCRNLPDTVKKATTERLISHREKYKLNTNLHGQLTNCLYELSNDATEDYRPFFDEADSRSGNKWSDVLVELK